MDITALVSLSVIRVEAVTTLIRYHIKTVEALLARAQDPQGREALSRLLGLTDEQTAEVLKEAQELVPGSDPAQQYPDVGKGALHPSLKRR